MDDQQLEDHFNEAAEVRRSDPEVSPGISAAHELDPEGLDGTSLGNAPLPKQEFNTPARDPVDPDFEAEQPTVEHAPAPELNGPAPPESMGRAQGELTFDENQQAVHEATGNDGLYAEWADEIKNGQDNFEGDRLNNDQENEGPDDEFDQN